MVSKSYEIVIHRSKADVFSYCVAIENYPKWRTGILEPYYTTEPPLRIGSEYRYVQRFFGGQRQVPVRIVDYQPGRLIKEERSFQRYTIWLAKDFESIEQGCRISIKVECTSANGLSLLEPLLVKRNIGNIERDYRNLKSLLES